MKKKEKENTVVSRFPFRKTLSVILAVVMAFSALPVAASAFDAEKQSDSAQEDIISDATEALPDENGETEREENLADEFEGLTEEEILEKVQNRRYTIETAGEEIAFRFNEEGSILVEDVEQAENFFAALGAPAELPVGVSGSEEEEGESYTFDERYLKDGYILDLYNFVTQHKSYEKIFDKVSRTYIYGINDIAYTDDNYDFKCDECGRCITGCTDGVLITFDEKSDPEGIHKKSAVITYTDEETGETHEELYEYYESIYDPETVDGKCDICGHNMCSSDTGHIYSDGKCDACGFCVNAHADRDGDNVCDVCNACLAGHTDENSDGECDECGMTFVCTHTDENADGKCDICGFCVLTSCVDSDNNGKCDRCGICVGDHKDENVIGGSEEIGDGKCDVCGKCMNNACSDTDGDGFCDTCKLSVNGCFHPDKEGVGKCDICGKCASGQHTDADFDLVCDVCKNSTVLCSAHEDPISDKCLVCGEDYCPMLSNAEIVRASSWFAAAVPFIIDNLASLMSNIIEMTTLHASVLGWKLSTSDLEMTYGRLDTMRASFEATDSVIQSNIKKAEQYIGVSAEKLFEDGSDKVISSAFAALISSLDSIKAMCEEKTTEEDENSTFTPRAKAYCEYFYKEKYGEIYGDASHEGIFPQLAGSCVDVLNLQIDYIFGEDYENGNGFVTKDNRLELQQKTETFNYQLYDILYGDPEDNSKAYYKIDIGSFAESALTANSIWTRILDLNVKLTSFSGKEKNIIGHFLISFLLTKVDELLISSFTAYNEDKEQYNKIPRVDGTDYYAVRKKMKNDLAREEVEDDYCISNESVTQLVKQIDNFITSEQFMKLLGIEGKGDLYAYVSEMIEGVFNNGDTFNELLNGVMEKLYPMACEFIDSGIHELLWNFVDKTFDTTTEFTPGNIGIWLNELAAWALETFADLNSFWAGTISGIFIGLVSFAYIHFDGGLDTMTFNEIVQEIGLAIYPDEIAARIEEYDSKNRLGDIVKTLKAADNDWTKVKFDKLDWCISDIESFEYAIGAFVSPFGDIPDLVFNNTKTLHIKLDNAARITANVLFLHVCPVAGSFAFNLEVETTPLNIYGQIIVPLLEAFGINNNTPDPSLNFKLYKTGAENGNYVSFADSLDYLINAVFALVKQIAANPLEKILSILPNLMFYLRNGFIPELLNISLEFQTATVKVSANDAGAFIAETAARLFVTVLVPALVLLAIPFVGPGLYAGVTATVTTIQVAVALFTATYLVNTGISLAGFANDKLKIGKILRGFLTKDKLGFNVNSVNDIARYLLGDSPLMNIIDLVDFTQIGYLGNLVICNGSGRDARTSMKYKKENGELLLGDGQYYFVEAEIGEVLWFIMQTVVNILSDEKAFGTILDMTGMKLEDVQAMIDALHLEQYGLNISVEKTIKGLTAKDLIFVLSELIVPSDKYDLKEITWTETDAETQAEIDGYGKIPYLEYDNIWDKDLATALTTDIAGSMDGILETVNGMVDLKATLGIEDVSSVGSIVSGLLDKYVEPSLITQVAKLLSGLTDTLGENTEMVEMLTRLDLSQWNRDFGYLFSGGDAPQSKSLPLLTAEKDGDEIVWKYNEKEVQSCEDIINAVCYLLKPLEKVLDFLFCGKDLGVVAYDKAGGISGEVITLKGSESYNYAVIPFLEALGVDSDSIPSQAQFNDMGSSAGLAVMLNLILGRVIEIANSPDFLSELLKIFTQLLYMFSSGGVDVLVSDLLHPVFVLIDIIRPVFDLDVDGIINTLLCKYTYTIGGYESEEEMRKVMTDRKCEFRIEDLTPQTLFNAVSVIASVKDGEERLFLDVNNILDTAFNDLAYLRKGYPSKAVDGEGKPVEGYKISADGADGLTVMISLLMEILMEGDTARIIDGIIGKPGLVDTVVDFLWGVEVEYSNNFNWAYILGEDASAQQKAALLEEIKKKGSISVEGRRTDAAQKSFDKYLEAYETEDELTNWNRWDKATAEYLEQYLTEMLETVLNDVFDEETGDRLADTLFEDASFPRDRDVTLGDVLNFLADGYITDETVDKIVFLAANLLTGDTLKDYKDIIYCVDGILDIDLSVFEAADRRLSGEKVVYLDKDGKETGLTRRVVKEKSDFAGALADILKPFSKLISWLLLGDDLEFFNTTGALSDRVVMEDNKKRDRRDDLIRIEGSEGYKYGLIPLLEAIGCKNLESADIYEKDGVYNTDQFLEDLIGSLMSWVLDIITSENGQSALDKLVTLLPNLFYYINSDGLTVSVNNIIATVNYALEIYSEKSGEDVSLASLIGFPLDDLTFNGIFDIIESIEFDAADASEEKCSLKFNSFIRNLLSTFTIGEIYCNSDSKYVYDTYAMRFGTDADRAKMLVILISFIFDFLEDPDNEAAFSSLLSPGIASTITNVFNMNNFRFEMQDFTWRFTEYKESNVLINALEMSDLFKGEQVYGTLFTRRMAAELADNLEKFISDMLYLIGLEIDGVPVRDFRSLIHLLLGSLVFNGETLDSITAALGQIKPLLDTYDKDGYIAGFVKELLDIDLHSWDKYAPGGKYEKGRDWGFVTEGMNEEAVDKNLTVFENALIELLSPIAPLITWLMCEEDFTLFVEGDGLGNDDEIQLTICGAEAYAYSFIPLMEALNVDGSPKDVTENLRRNNILSPAEYTEKAKEDDGYALYGIVHPLMAKVGNIMDSTLPEILELLPSIVYFINCNGLDTCVKNLIHAGLIILRAIEPMAREIETFVFDEQGINIYKTIDFEGIMKNTVYAALGITEKDMVELYRAMGDEYKTVDGLEDIDFKFLFAVLVAKLNGLMKDAGLEFKFTTIAADAVRELTCGYVRGFTSLNGRQAYTMILSKDIDSQCYGDLITILIRLVLKFLSVDNNADALMHLIQAEAKMNPIGYEILDSLLKLLVRYIASPNNTQIAMTSVYYTVYGLSVGSGSGLAAYDNVNAKWTQVVGKLEKLNNPIASEIMKTIISIADVKTEGVIDSEGIASNGFFGFFKKIIEWIRWLFESIKNLFK